MPRYKPYNQYRRFADEEPPCFVVLFLFMSLITIFSLPFFYLYVNQDKGPKKIVTSKLVDARWPIYPFFDKDNVTANSSQPDHLLLDKLLLDIAYLQTPMFKLNGSQIDFKIPRIIHQSWKSDAVPAVTIPWIKKWKVLHPDWTYMFWTDKTATQFLKQYYPDLWGFYNSWNLPVQKSDMFRVLVIYSFGGVWADLDMEPLKSLDPVRNWSSCVLARHPLLQTYLIDNTNRGDIYATNYTYPINAFFACRAGHPFMFYLLSRLIGNSPHWTKQKCELSRTVACSGPRLMALANAFYLRSVPQTVRSRRPDLDVISPDPDYFMPTYDTTYKVNVKRVKHLCKIRHKLSEMQEKLCDDFNSPNHVNAPKDISYTVHKWFHSYNFGRRTLYYRGRLNAIIPYKQYSETGLFEIVNSTAYIKPPSSS